MAIKEVSVGKLYKLVSGIVVRCDGVDGGLWSKEFQATIMEIPPGQVYLENDKRIFAGETVILVPLGAVMSEVSEYKKSIPEPFGSNFAYRIYKQKYSLEGKETWRDTCVRVVDAVTGPYLDVHTRAELYSLMYTRKFIPGGRYLYSSGRDFHQVNNCMLYRAEDSREGWAELMHSITSALMSGAGVGVDYSAVRPEGAVIQRAGGTSTGPLALMQMVNEAGRHIMQGGARRSAIWAGLRWDHPDIPKFLTLKDYPEHIRKAKEVDFTFPVTMEGTNISVVYGTDFFEEIRSGNEKALSIWKDNCRASFSSAEPGMSFNFGKDRESLRNACCEVTSEDDSDKCNLGTLWLNRIESREELARAVDLATAFLLCGGMYSHVPTDKVREVGTRNNRIGLGLGGLHEWLMLRGEKYEVTPELHSWLRVYQRSSDVSATLWSRKLGVAEPKGKRAIAPTGTIGILAESTTGIEPLFCKAYKRRYLVGHEWKYEYVVDGTVRRLQEKGVALEKIQDAYDITFRERVAFQANVQQYVDMAISSTCNLPAWGSPGNNVDTLEEYTQILLEYAPRLRGFTCYPDGCRGGQPLTRVSLEEALGKEGVVYEEQETECVGGVCGI